MNFYLKIRKTSSCFTNGFWEYYNIAKALTFILRKTLLKV